ncbi:MAG: siderophore-interacting protein [Rubrivivax sp.]
MTMDERPPKQIMLQRHPLRYRELQVLRVQTLSPRMRRITLGGDALAGFASPAPDDHVRLVFPAPGEAAPIAPSTDEHGLHFPDGPLRPAMRDYTPRRCDGRELDLDFVLHGHGPAASWAAQAAPGMRIGVAGPRGSHLVGVGFDGYVLIGDETALPAIGRWLETLPAAAPVLCLVEVADAAEQAALAVPPGRTVHWLHRREGAPDALLQALRNAALPPGDRFCWIACESAQMRALRRHLIDDRGQPRAWLSASGYWKRDTADHQDEH